MCLMSTNFLQISHSGHCTPTWAFLLCYILSVVICLTIEVMCTWHLWNVVKGETTVENHDFEAYCKLAKSREDICSYHLDWLLLAQEISDFHQFFQSGVRLIVPRNYMTHL